MARHRMYSYAPCGTCRTALAWLNARRIEVDVLDITSTPPTTAELRQALAQFGGLGRLFNTSGQSYRALGAATVKAMGEAEALAALAADGKLIKRPFLITSDGRMTTGFKPEEWQDLLG